MNNIKKKVLISGAGIAGLTTAYWLHTIGWEVVIIEKASQLREGEFVIDFSGTGWDVAVKMGLEDELRKKEMKIDALSFQNYKGEQQSYINMGDFVESMGVGNKHVSINRRDLQNMIYDLVKDDVEVRFSTSIDSLEERNNGQCVEVIFNDRTKDRFDLVVGADGLHSNVRKLAFPKQETYQKHLGYHVSAFRVKNVQGQSPGRMNILRRPGKQAGILDLRDGDSLALFVYANNSNEYIPREYRKQVLLDAFGDVQGSVPAVLAAIQDDTAIYMDTTTQIVMPQWYTNRIALVGDAAYCLTLVSGQGASLAMGGAYVLAKALASNSAENIDRALLEYDDRLRDFVEELQLKSQNFAGQFIPDSHLGLWFTNKMVALVKNKWVKKYVGKLFSVQSLFEREVEESSPYAD